MKHIILIITILTIQACAFTDAKLDVQHNQTANFIGPIKDIQSLDFLSPILEDNRTDKQRIGWKKNGYGQQTADITTIESVETIITNAINAGLKQNGHSLSDSGRVKIAGSVNRFWFDMDINFFTIEFIGDIQCSLDFIDTKTNSLIYKSDYSGTYSEKKGGGLNKTWQNIMSKTVDKLIQDIVFDEDLAESLEKLNP